MPTEHSEATSRRFARTALGLVLACSVVISPVACSVGPTYVRPTVRLNPTWNIQDPRLAAEVAIDIAWWRGFADPSLDHLIDLAYHQNLSLQVAGLRILEARAQLGVAIGDLYPKNVDPIASASVQGLSKYAPNGALVDRHFSEYQVGFDAVWELDFWGKYRKGVKAADAAFLATIADYDGALVALSAEVARSYVVIRTFEVLIDQARENVVLEEEGLEIARSRFRNGATSELDVAQATTLLETTRASIPSLEASLGQAQNALSTLLGQPTGAVQGLMTTPRVIPAPPARVAVSVPAELLRRRPDIRGAELRAIAQCDRIGVAKAELYPKFVLFGSVGTQTSTSGNSTLRSLFGPGSFVYSAGGSLFWPLLNRRQIRNNVRIEDARFQQALVEYVNTVLTAAQEVDDGIVGYLRQQDAAVFQQNAVTAAEQAVKLAMVQYREGAIDYQRVLDTQRERLDSQNRLANTRSAAATNLIGLYKALGGGWEMRIGQPVIPDSTRREMQNRTSWGKHFTEPRRAEPQKGKR